MIKNIIDICLCSIASVDQVFIGALKRFSVTNLSWSSYRNSGTVIGKFSQEFVVTAVFL